MFVWKLLLGAVHISCNRGGCVGVCGDQKITVLQIFVIVSTGYDTLYVPCKYLHYMHFLLKRYLSKFSLTMQYPD